MTPSKSVLLLAGPGNNQHGGTEAVRLQHRWSPVVAAVAIGCDIVLTVVVIALRDVIVY